MIDTTNPIIGVPSRAEWMHITSQLRRYHSLFRRWAGKWWTRHDGVGDFYFWK